MEGLFGAYSGSTTIGYTDFTALKLLAKKLHLETLFQNCYWQRALLSGPILFNVFFIPVINWPISFELSTVSVIIHWR